MRCAVADRLFVLGLTSVVLLAIETAMGAESHPAVTDLTQVDADFQFQGEYVGTVLLATGVCQPIGLQVVPQGGGQFFAVEYEGGLPGTSACGPARIRIEAERHGDTVVFVSEPLRVTVYNGVATLTIEPRGLQIAQLTKTYRISPTLGDPPPAGAIALFDGTNTDHFVGGRMTDDGLLMVGTQLKETYRDFQMHLEFRLAYMPSARGQGRSNSGIYLQSRYEVQILDSFGLEGVENECAALYKQRRPDVNMCLPPLTWQTYDIDFRAAEFDDQGRKIANAVITVLHNGVPVHDNVEIVAKTGAGSREGPDLLPIKFQNHHNPVVFRNIWLIDRSPGAASDARADARCVPCP